MLSKLWMLLAGLVMGLKIEEKIKPYLFSVNQFFLMYILCKSNRLSSGEGEKWIKRSRPKSFSVTRKERIKEKSIIILCLSVHIMAWETEKEWVRVKDLQQ